MKRQKSRLKPRSVGRSSINQQVIDDLRVRSYLPLARAVDAEVVENLMVPVEQVIEMLWYQCEVVLLNRVAEHRNDV
jgi:hypothetical protein